MSDLLPQLYADRASARVWRRVAVAFVIVELVFIVIGAVGGQFNWWTAGVALFWAWMWDLRTKEIHTLDAQIAQLEEQEPEPAHD